VRIRQLGLASFAESAATDMHHSGLDGRRTVVPLAARQE
jgi:hypothetical protein